jgi:serine/threonine protein phosphatase PrpC
MNRDEATSQWQVVGQSVRGASHERSGMPNQDAISWLPESGAGASMVLAVADGHGGARYSRSHTGADIAVRTATRLIQDFLSRQADTDNLSWIKRTAEEWLPGALVREWREGVRKHIEEYQFNSDEINPLDPGEKYLALNVQERLAIPYGATILAAAVTEKFVLCLQLGDGEILTVTDGGEVSKPIAKDDRLFANETTSLCTPNAWRDFRVSFQPITRSQPALILLATDGYPNSFRDESGFLKVGSDMLEIIKAEGLSSVKEKLAGWLADSTNAGSGDDVTLGILCSVRPREEKPKVTVSPKHDRRSGNSLEYRLQSGSWFF